MKKWLLIIFVMSFLADGDRNYNSRRVEESKGQK
jgi:hypothetical protein